MGIKNIEKGGDLVKIRASEAAETTRVSPLITIKREFYFHP